MEILYDNIIIDFLPLCALAGDDIILSKEINLKTVCSGKIENCPH